DKLVSVIMPVYNGGIYLEQAIKSIIDQTYTNIELIIIDDGSKDDSLELINRFMNADKRISCLSRENKGLVYTLNELISMAKGDYIARMDADDYSRPDRIKEQVDYLNANPQIYLCGTNFEIMSDDELTESDLKYLNIFKDMVDNFTTSPTDTIFYGHHLLHPTWMFRKQLIDLVGGYRNYKHYEDGEFLFRVAYNGLAVGKVDKTLLDYRVHAQSKSFISSQQSELKLDSMRFHIDYYIDSLKEDFTNRDIYIWGTAFTGESTYRYLRNKSVDIKGFIDSNANIDFNNKPVYKPDEVDFSPESYVLISTNSGYNYASNYLRNKGLREYADFAPTTA
nr:glycosyltransferase [Lachnospiraceae bacterium]